MWTHAFIDINQIKPTDFIVHVFQGQSRRGAMAYVFHNLVLEAMVLAPVDALSDEEPRRNQSAGSPNTSAQPKAKSGAKPGPKAKSKGTGSKAQSKTASGKAKAKAKAKSEEKAKDYKSDEANVNETPEEEEEEEEEEEVIPKKKPASNARCLKRPAASSAPSSDTKVPKKYKKVYKYRYKTGKWAFKVNGKEVMGVSCQNQSRLCQTVLPLNDSG